MKCNVMGHAWVTEDVFTQPFGESSAQPIIQEDLSRKGHNHEAWPSRGSDRRDEKKKQKKNNFCLCWGFMALWTQWDHVERGQFTKQHV